MSSKENNKTYIKLTYYALTSDEVIYTLENGEQVKISPNDDPFYYVLDNTNP